MPDVSKSIVLITGCDTGFGALSAIELSDSGYRVVAACLTEEGVARLDQKVTLSIVCDVTKEDDVIKLATAVEKLAIDENLNLWAVVNNAHTYYQAKIDIILPNNPLLSFEECTESARARSWCSDKLE